MNEITRRCIQWFDFFLDRHWHRVRFYGGLLMIIFALYDCFRAEWISPRKDINAQDIHHSIYSGQHHVVDLQSLDHTFSVAYVKCVSKDLIHPSFPAIHIVADVSYDAWMHIVHIVDGARSYVFAEIKEKEAVRQSYPFYTTQKDFYNTSSCKYNFIEKPFEKFEGHAYAVKIDAVSGAIIFCGGVKWGYGFAWYRLGPRCITPQALGVDDWHKDMEMLMAQGERLAKKR